MNKDLKDKIASSLDVFENISAVQGLEYTAMLHTYVQHLTFERVLERADCPEILRKTYRLILRTHLEGVIMVVMKLKSLPEKQAIDEASKDIETILKAVSIPA